MLKALIGEFHDQDAILGCQAHQNEQTHLGIDIQRETPQLQADQGTEQGHGHGEQDDQWVEETFVKPCQQQIHNREAQGKQHPGHRFSPGLFFGQSCEGESQIGSAGAIA